jgi:SAM-dependent methyltransferase
MSYEQQLDKISKLFDKKFNTLKQIGLSPKGLSRFDYISELLPNIDNYMITDKADGIRSIIDIDSVKSIAKCIIGSNYFELNKVSGKSSIIECEVLNDKKIILIYDIFEYNNELLINKPFNERYTILSKLSIKHSEWKFKIKTFIKLTLSNYSKSIMQLYDIMKKAEYNTDGIIFTFINNNYLKTNHYKWKPPEHLTIDFLVVENLQLWSGISQRLFKQIGLTLPENYNQIASKWVKFNNDIIINEYFPIPFTPSISPLVYLMPIKNAPKDLVGKIVELSWNNNSWIFHRIRDDRDKELKEGHYFGNNFEVAELTYELIINPLTLKDLISPIQILTKNFYFEKTDDKYKSARNFNSYVKSQLISRNYGAKYVIDMASGKGQDLGRYYFNKIKNLLMLEIDQSAIDELITRKYDIAKKIRIDAPIKINSISESTNLLISQMDLNQPSELNINKIESIFKNFKSNSVDLIICNFAFHYLVEDISHINNIVSFISYWLKPGGEFMFTALNSEKINPLIKTEKWEVGPYKIERKSPNIINVLLPCSTEMREEPQINLNLLDKEFNKYRIIRIETKDFSEFFPKYKNISNLNEEDKQFVSLYQYCIYKKI